MAAIGQDDTSTSTTRSVMQPCPVKVAKSFQVFVIVPTKQHFETNSADEVKSGKSGFSLIVTPVLNFSKSRCPSGVTEM